MRVEKLNDTQIKVVLDQDEIKEKNIDVKGILRGSSKAKEALNSLVIEAIDQVGVEVDEKNFVTLDIPHVSDESVEFVLTILDISDKSELDALRTISSLFESLGYGDELSKELKEFEERISGWGTPENPYGERKSKTPTNTKQPEKSVAKPVASKSVLTKPMIYSFENIEYLAKVAAIFLNNKITFIDSKVYQKDARYFLVLTKKSTTKVEKVEAILAEYGLKVNQHEYVLEEHGKLLIKKDAINVLNTYF